RRHPAGPADRLRRPAAVLRTLTMATTPDRLPDAGPDRPGDSFFLGLDLGQSQDFSALVALRRRDEPDPARPDVGPWRYWARGIMRCPPRPPSPPTVAEVGHLVGRPPLSGCILGGDRTGCGQPVVDMLRQAQPQAQPEPVLITAGHAVTQEDYCWHVPKTE